MNVRMKFWSIFVICTIASIVFTGIAVTVNSTRVDQCEQRNGILVRTVLGHGGKVCISKSVVIETE